jgi:hypothetical protein
MTHLPKTQRTADAPLQLELPLTGGTNAPRLVQELAAALTREDIIAIFATAGVDLEESAAEQIQDIINEK